MKQLIITNKYGVKRVKYMQDDKRANDVAVKYATRNYHVEMRRVK